MKKFHMSFRELGFTSTKLELVVIVSTVERQIKMVLVSFVLCLSVEMTKLYFIMS